MNELFKCICGEKYNKNIFKKHYKKCKLFLNKYSEFDNIISHYLNNFSLEELQHIKFLFNRYIKLIDFKINKNQQNNNIIYTINNNFGNNSPYNNEDSFNNYEYIKHQIITNEIKIKVNQKKEPISNIDFSYANSFLQSIASLKCIKNWFHLYNINENINNSNFPLINEFYNLLFNIYNKKKSDSNKILLEYEKQTKMLLNIKNNKEPFDFINNFLKLLHFENNYYNFNDFYINQITIKNIKLMSNDEFMYSLYESFLNQMNNSDIFNLFFSTIKYIRKCQNCPNFYFYNINLLFSFEIEIYKKYRDEAYPSKRNDNINLDECFKCYFGKRQIKCISCGNQTSYESKAIFKYSKVLIIYFKRNMHNYQCDVDFKNEISITDYIYSKENNDIKFQANYILKACICYNQKYFSNIFINNTWYRYIDDKIEILDYPEKQLYEFEPQILLYELNESKNIKKEKKIKNINNNNIIIDPKNKNKKFSNILKQIKAFELYNQQNRNIFEFINPYINHTNKEILNPFYININFYIISKKGIDNILSIQANYDDNIEEIINKFFNQSNENIKTFILNGEIIDINSKIKLRKSNIKNDYIILAIKNDKY